MAPKAAKVYTIEELKAKCRMALMEPNLVDLARLTPNQAHYRAFEYVYGKTNDFQIAEKLAVATRFLAILHREHQNDFEKLIVQEKQAEPEAKPIEPKKKFSEIEFRLPEFENVTTEIIYKDRGRYNPERSVRFADSFFGDESDARRAGKEFCMEILNALIETAGPSGSLDIRDDLIQLLEEKFGLKVKVCGNCRYLGKIPWPEVGYMLPENNIGGRWPCHAPPDRGSSTDEFKTCKDWSPKETSEKKEN